MGFEVFTRIHPWCNCCSSSLRWSLLMPFREFMRDLCPSTREDLIAVLAIALSQFSPILAPQNRAFLVSELYLQLWSVILDDRPVVSFVFRIAFFCRVTFEFFLNLLKLLAVGGYGCVGSSTVNCRSRSVHHPRQLIRAPTHVICWLIQIGLERHRIINVFFLSKHGRVCYVPMASLFGRLVRGGCHLRDILQTYEL